MVEKWCRMKCRLTGWHLEPILIIISIHGFEDFISYPRCRSLAGFWIVATISNSFPARTPDPVISNDSVVRARCQHPVRHLHYQEVQHLHYLPKHLLFSQVPSAYHPVLHVPTFTLCTIDDSIFSSVPSVKNPSHSKVYPPVCIEHPLLYPQWLAPKLQGTTSKLPRRPVGTNPKISLPEETNLDRMGHGVSPAWHLVHCHQRWKWCLLDLTKTSFNLLPPWRSHICKYKHKLQQFVCEEWASVEFIQ